MYFCFFIYLPLKKGVALYLNKLDFPLPMGALCQDWMKLFHFFRKRFFAKFCQSFFTIYTYLPLIINVALHLNKIKSSSLKNALCYVLLKSAQWFRRRRFYNFINSSLFLYHLPFEKSKTLYLNSVYPRIKCTKFLDLAW